MDCQTCWGKNGKFVCKEIELVLLKGYYLHMIEHTNV